MTPTDGGRVLRLATRGSPLALFQARRVADRLQALPEHPRCELVVVRTSGDERPDLPLTQIGGQGAFVKEVQTAVLEGAADLAVHSAKDLPSLTPPGLLLASCPERADPRDALVGARLADLPTAALVATGSVRRRAQLAWLRPDLGFCELRGNMATRLRRAQDIGAGVLAFAALERLGLSAHVAEVLEPRVMLPQVGQGALALECREEDHDTATLLRAVDDPPAHAALQAERAFLAELGGGCSLPIGALATFRDEATLVIDGMLASRDGRIVLRRAVDGPAAQPAVLGRRLAGELLDGCGGRALDDWRDDCDVARDAGQSSP
jgi:hydroxymethylbilane synthase